MESFKSVVKGIKHSEKNVDKVLRAARLERHESGAMSDARLEMILGHVVGIIAIIAGTVLACVFMVAM